jgi:hypothetical protein
MMVSVILELEPDADRGDVADARSIQEWIGNNWCHLWRIYGVKRMSSGILQTRFPVANLEWPNYFTYAIVMPKCRDYVICVAL